MKLALTFSLILLTSLSQAQLRLVKINLPSAALGALSVSFEKVIKKQYSWQAGLTYRPAIASPKMFYNQSRDDFNIEESSSTWMGAHLECRFYTQKARRLQTKPYLSFYGRYLLSQSNITYVGPNKVSSTSSYQLDQDFQQLSFGIQYGIQWVFNNRFSIDWTVMGFGLTHYQINAKMTTDEDGSVGRLEEALSSVPFVGSKYLFKGDSGEFEINSQFFSLSPRTALRFGLLF